MPESLEKLRELRLLDYDTVHNALTPYLPDDLADEIQAEVDEKYVPRVGAAYQMLADPKLDDEAVNSAYEILKEYGTLDAYIDKFYLPRPLFEDGEPVQIGDYVDLQMDGKRRVQVMDIQPWIVYGSSTSHQREPYKRPPEPDTQEKIDKDVKLAAILYCEQYAIGSMGEDPVHAKMRDLLARQRKLDGVE